MNCTEGSDVDDSLVCIFPSESEPGGWQAPEGAFTVGLLLFG